MNTKVTALAVADYFIYKANSSNKKISNKKLQKLLYYAQAWSLVLLQDKLFDEKIEAWVHGPAIKRVYDKYKIFGFNPITKDVAVSVIESIPSKTQALLDNVWSVYGDLDAEYLEMLTHSEVPWQEAREGLQNSESSESEISLTTMRDFYVEKLKKSAG